MSNKKKDMDLELFYWGVGISVFISILITIFYVSLLIDEKLKDVPHKICHNETRGFFCTSNSNMKSTDFYIGLNSSNISRVSVISKIDNNSANNNCIPDNIEVCEIK